MNVILPRKRPKPKRRTGRLDCQGHRTFVKSFYCVAYGLDPKYPCSELIDAHHTTTKGAGGGDDTCVPMCRAHHSQLDSPGWSQKRFEEHYKLDLKAQAAELARISPPLRRYYLKQSRP